MTKLVQMSGIEKSFPGVRALHGVSFDLLAGEVHALMGENGAGKSTLMKILAGIYQRDGGDMHIAGRRVSPATPRAAQQLGIGIIHQELSLINDLSAAQNIFIGREPRARFGRLDQGALHARSGEIFAAMKLNLDPAVRVGELSIAGQQMVEIAKALSYRSRVLIMDEPTAALNEAEIEQLFAIIRRLKAEGTGIVYISHKMDELKRIADRVSVLRDGAYVGTVDAAATSTRRIISMMVGREVNSAVPVVPDLSAAEIALQVDRLSRAKAVQEVSFSLKKGEILGFAGLMGAGRTELARAIFGADRADSGDIRVHGRTLSIASPVDAVRAGIGYVPEDRKHCGLVAGMSVGDNIALAALQQFTAYRALLDDGAMARAADGYIHRLGIRTPSPRQPVGLLSGGNQQKVVIAKWLLCDCDILIVDEPTRGIDIGAKEDIYTLLEALAAQGKSLIVISSELPEIMRLSHRVAVMCEGRLSGILPGGEGLTQQDIMQLATRRHRVGTALSATSQCLPGAPDG